MNALTLKTSRRGAVILATLLLLVASLPKPQPAKADHDAVIIEGVPSVVQWYSLSCEYAAAATITLYWGNLVSQSVFVREVPLSPDPHKGFRGNIHGPHGGLEDYGVYASALVPVLQKYGYHAEVFYDDLDLLKAEIRNGFPVVVWLTSGRYTERPVYRETYGDRTFKLVPYEHAVVAYGYDSDGIYTMDVGNGGFFHTPWDSFLMRWNYFDGMSLLIHPE